MHRESNDRRRRAPLLRLEARSERGRSDRPRRRIGDGRSAARQKLFLALTVASLAVVTAGSSAGSATARSNATKAVRPARARVVALWHMDERSGKVMRDAIRNHDGTLNSVQVGLPGFSGTAYGFNGSSSYLSLPSARDLNPHRKRIVIAMHLKTGSAPARSDWDLIRKGFYASPGGEYKMEYYPSGRVSCGFNGSIDYSELIARPRLNDGHWHDVRCVKTRSRITAVVDGRRFSKRVRVGKIANGARVVIGARPGADRYKGSLDEAKIKIG
jgi:Concanavalin A-like lectin/glucanases superfamily